MVKLNWLSESKSIEVESEINEQNSSNEYVHVGELDFDEIKADQRYESN